MAAPHGDEHVIRIADGTPPVEEHRVEQDPPNSKRTSCMFCFCIIFVTVAMIVGLGVLSWLDQNASYSLSIDGLDSAAPRSVNAVPTPFNLTVRVRNQSRIRWRCVYEGSSATVWYNGTVIAEGAVSPLCAGKRAEGEVVVPVPGVAVHAPLTWLPSPNEMQKSGAVVDVALSLAKYYSSSRWCRGIKVGGGLSWCSR